MKRPKNKTRLEPIAYHEAGHAIAAWILEHRVDRVTIEPTVDYLGQAVHPHPLRGMEYFDYSPKTQRRAENTVKICLAGVAAQRKYNPRSVRRSSGSRDYEEACGVLFRLCDSDEEEMRAYFRLLQIQTRNLVENPVNWKAIDILARELLKRRTMSRKSLREFIISRGFRRPAPYAKS